MIVETIKEWQAYAKAMEWSDWGWIYLGMVLTGWFFTILRDYVLSFRINRLEQRTSCVENHSGWLVPTPSIFESPTFKLRRAIAALSVEYDPSLLAYIHPWQRKAIVALTIYAKQSASLSEIALQRRLLTVSAVVHGFAVPNDLLLVDEHSIKLYQEYRRVTKPAMANLEQMEAEYKLWPASVDPALVRELTPHVTLIATGLAEHVERETWLPFYEFAEFYAARLGITVGEIRAVLTAYSAYTGLPIPNDYLDNTALAYALYLSLSGPVAAPPMPVESVTV